MEPDSFRLSQGGRQSFLSDPFGSLRDLAPYSGECPEVTAT